MNVPAIRAALLRLQAVRVRRNLTATEEAVARVGLRACDEARKKCGVVACHGLEDDAAIVCTKCSNLGRRLEVIADILREAGVPLEVEG